MIKRFFGQGSERTQKTKKSIFLLFFFHMFNMIITLALVPLSIQLLGNVRYGVWVTVSSVIFWLNYLDFGIGNGLRNKVAESFALSDTQKARTYVSTAYFIFLLAALCVIIITLILNLFVNWQYVLNAPLDLSGELKLIMPFAFALFATQVFLKLINSIINADQRPALNGLISLLINGFSIGGLYILFISHNNSFLAFATVSFLMPVIILLVVSVILFKTSYTEIAPSYRCIDLSTSRALFSLGMQFFIIQAAGLVVFATQNLIISQVLGPAQVTVYNVALRYFSLVTLVFGVILTPFWSAYTEAYVKKDFIWIKKMVNKIILL
ncbi:MAG: hypothetical protein HYV28_12585, partial [Ignavibacteriales bacterium]|nr:hypothetical protein [Ignavibacteriales bacterium]